MNKLQDIAQLTRLMENQEAKNLVVDNWDKVEEISRDRVKASQFIDAIVTEEKEAIRELLKGSIT